MAPRATRGASGSGRDSSSSGGGRGTGSSGDAGLAGSDAEERLLGDGLWLLLNAEQSLQAFTRGNRLAPRATRGDSGSGSDSSSSGSGSRTGSKPCTDFATRAK